MVKIYALVSGQLVLYVGRTIRPLKIREQRHRCPTNDTHSKYIPDYIDWTIKLLEEVPDDQGTVKEQYWYDTLKPFYNCYNPCNANSKNKYRLSNAGKQSQKLCSHRYYLKKKAERDQS